MRWDITTGVWRTVVPVRQCAPHEERWRVAEKTTPLTTEDP